MNSLIQELVNDLKSNSAINENVMVKMILESINNSSLLGLSPDQILENSLSNLSHIATVTVNENINEVVAKFRKLAEKPTNSLQKMAKEAGLSMKMKALKESSLNSDPIFNHTLSVLEKKLEVYPEFRLIGLVIETLNGFAYDSNVKQVIEDLSNYVFENRAKLEIINAIYEMRQASPVVYRESIAELENCLMEGVYLADAVKMKLHGKPNMPILTRLINTLSMVESSETGNFNIGIGNGDAQVKPVIAPFYKMSDSEAVAFIDNSFVKLADDEEPAEATMDELEAYPEFTEICEAFHALNFKETKNGIISKGRNISIEFDVNAEDSLDLKINGVIVEDLSQIKFADLLVMEHLSTRTHITKLLNNLDVIVNFGFIKKLVNERLNADALVFTLGETQFVFEKYGNGRLIKRMQGLEFHDYVMEKFNYDVSDLYAIELEERERFLKDLQKDKNSIESDIDKLEKTIKELEDTLVDPSLNEEYSTQLADLKIAIEKNINVLKNQYIELELSKKKP
jgi:hypothetical protein